MIHDLCWSECILGFPWLAELCTHVVVGECMHSESLISNPWKPMLYEKGLNVASHLTKWNVGLLCSHLGEPCGTKYFVTKKRNVRSRWVVPIGKLIDWLISNNMPFRSTYRLLAFNFDFDWLAPNILHFLSTILNRSPGTGWLIGWSLMSLPHPLGHFGTSLVFTVSAETAIWSGWSLRSTCPKTKPALVLSPAVKLMQF